MQSQWLTVPRPDSGSVSVVPREPACAAGRGVAQSFSGSCGREWHWRWHWLRCQLRGWPHTQLTNSETLFVAFPLRLFASLQYTLLSHALPSPQHLLSPLGQGVDSCDKSLCRKHLNCISLWGNLQGWAGPKQRQMRMQILFWRHIENSVVAVRPRSPSPCSPRSTKFNPPTEHCASLLWPCAGECAPNEAYKWPLSWLQLELELGTGIGYTATRLLASGVPLYTNMVSAVPLP